MRYPNPQCNLPPQHNLPPQCNLPLNTTYPHNAIYPLNTTYPHNINLYLQKKKKTPTLAHCAMRIARTLSISCLVQIAMKLRHYNE